MTVQIKTIQSYWPLAPLLGVGSSAGTGLLVRYLGEEGEKSQFTAAIAICPGYDTGPGKAFSRFDDFFDKLVLQSVKKLFFHEANIKVLSSVAGYEVARDAATLASFQEAIYLYEGYSSVDEMYQFTNPMAVARAITTPSLVFNSVDDPLCVIQNVYDNITLFDEPFSRILVVTDRGSHCAYHEGSLWPRGSWCERVSLDYFQAVLDIQKTQVKQGNCR